MHIQDGYLSTSVCAATAVVSLGTVAFSLHKLKDSLADRTIPMTGMMASLIFAGQMVNFPIGLPVSGHLLGGVLAATVVGPWAACVAMTLVLFVQWSLFSDGGLIALGANVLHMGVVGGIGGYAVMSAVRRQFHNPARGTVVGAIVAAWLSVLAAAALFCAEFRLSHPSGDFDYRRIFVLMIALHSLIGVGEAFITGSVLSLICQQRPDLIYSPSASTKVRGMSRILVAGMVGALAVGAFLAPFASSLPDGLDAVASQFTITSSDDAIGGIWADYGAVPTPLGTWETLAISIAGIGGTLVVFASALVLGRAIQPRTASPQPADGGST